MPLTNQIRYIKARLTADGTPATGFTSGNFTASYLINGGTLTSLTKQTISVLGTYQAPSSAAHIRIAELSGSDPTAGIYEVHFHDTQLATGAKLWLFLSAPDADIDPLEVDLTDVSGRLPTALSANGNIKADLRDVLAAALTETSAGYLAAAFKKLFDVATPLLKADSFSANTLAQLALIYDTDRATNYDATNHYWNQNPLQLLPTTPLANSYGEAAFIADILAGRINTCGLGTPTSTTIYLDGAASSDNTAYIGDAIYLYNGTGGGIRGTGQRRTIVGYNGTTKVATVDRAWTTTPDSTTKFIILPEPLGNVGLWVSQLVPTPNVTGVPKVDATHLLGTAWLIPAVAGTPDVNAKKVGGAVQTEGDIYGVVGDETNGNSAIKTAISSLANSLSTLIRRLYGG